MFYSLGSALAGFVAPAAAIVLFTILIRLLTHPLTRSAVRAEKARNALAPEVRKLQEKHGKDVVKLQEATMKLYQDSGTSMFAGFLPMFAQIPFFMVVYRLVTTPNPLLDSTFLGAPLGTGWLTGFGHTPVFLGLFAALALVALGSVRWSAMMAERNGVPQTPLTRVLRYLPFGTVLMAAVLPLAAGIYLLTTTTWTLIERAWLHRAAARPPRAGAGARSRTT
ncbi:YidC/Oxa1 family membrane protein insertase [Umezawaea endophytica]|uniref:Membrane protein insertase YidC n=1 Tax=Umezawaea endophytica TaxID=1654476 RepID=A0A9X2VGF7_9PSEU|nr:YidC/Oxa1 family membrane protein insertase [Umezawaea endophytica]MCS7476151.1 YidC/Oxa1 family membrane protein insertase [Umezawaea endophytica]